MARKRKVADEKPSSTGSTPQTNSTMARKRKVVDEKPTSNGSTPQPNGAKKRRIDWSTVDKDLSFKITAVTVRKHKKPSKSAKSKQGAVNGGHVSEFDAPLDAETTQPNPYPETQLPELHVKIKPALYWEAMRRYRRFTVNGEEFEVGQMIFVKKSEEDKIAEGPGSIEHWIAKVLEVRGGDPEHVFLRVYWAYRPEDIPGGRQAHHGDSELIVSNHMDIIDALSVNSSADVVYWDDDPDSLDLKRDQLFFRQSYDITKRANSQLSKLKTYCIDKKPCNPDELILQCPQCSEWLHADCLKERALQDAAPQLKKRGRPSQVQASTTLDARIKTQDNKARLTILERRGGKPKRKWDVDILCLVCGGMVEEASDKASKEVPETSDSDFGSDAAADDKYDIIPTASVVAKAPIQDDDADSVIGDAESDQDVEAKNSPTSNAEIKVPRKRGRPPGSKNKRKRTPWASTKKSTLPHAKYRKTEMGREGVFPHATYDMDAITVVEKTAKTVSGSAKKATAMTALGSTNDATASTQPSSPQAASSPPHVASKPTPLSPKPAEEVLPTTAHQTPAPAPISESVFQSGVRSVKKLFWRGS